MQNDIPLGVGLGSSAAAIVAGILLGAELCGVELDAAETLAAGPEIEGHPDNIAAAVHGGMVVAAITSQQAAKASEPGKCWSPRVDVSPKLDFVAVIPEMPLPTEKARAVLPAQYSRADVVANLQRTALLTACFFSGGRLSPELFRDRLHQPYRSPLVPGIAECAGVSPSWTGGNFSERGGFGGYGYRRAQRRANWGGAGRRISAPGVRSQGAAVEGGQSRRAGNHGTGGALARPGGSDANASRVKPLACLARRPRAWHLVA